MTSRAGWMTASGVWAALLVAVASQITGSAARYSWAASAMGYACAGMLGAYITDLVITWRADRAGRDGPQA